MGLNLKRPGKGSGAQKTRPSRGEALSQIGTDIEPDPTVDLVVPVSRIAPSAIEVNPENSRDTFKTKAAFIEFLGRINWDFSNPIINAGHEATYKWLDETATIYKENEPLWPAFEGIIARALDINDKGQLQPVVGYEESGHYKTIIGSTRVLACILLDRLVEFKMSSFEDSLDELRAVIAENKQRSDLSFGEELKANLKLLQQLLDKKAIERISKPVVMRELGMAEKTAQRWAAVMNEALINPDFSAWAHQSPKAIRGAYEGLTALRDMDSTEPLSDAPETSDDVSTDEQQQPDAQLLNSLDEEKEKRQKEANEQRRYATKSKVKWRGSQKDHPLVIRCSLNMFEREYRRAVAGATESHQQVAEGIKDYLQKTWPWKTMDDAQEGSNFLTGLLLDQYGVKNIADEASSLDDVVESITGSN